MSNADIYIERYKELEQAVRFTYGINKGDSISYYLKNQGKFRRYKNEIELCQDVRNLIQHDRKIGDAYTVQPTEQMIRFITDLTRKVKNRQRCVDIAINIEKICWCSMNDSLLSAMESMRANVYTHIPILENGHVLGVFDENALFNYLANEKIILLENDLRFENVEKYLSLDNREMESFLFEQGNTYVDEVERKIEDAFRRNQRIGMVFITSNGDRSGVLQGIITPWDIIASYREK